MTSSGRSLMYSRKSVGARMESWGTFHPEPLEAVYYKEKKKLGQISDLKFHRLRFMKKTNMPNPVKSNISSATYWVAQNLLKALAILLDTTVRRSGVDREELKPYWKSEKRSHFSVSYKFLEDFTNQRKKTNRVVVFNCRPTDESFQ